MPSPAMVWIVPSGVDIARRIGGEALRLPGGGSSGGNGRRWHPPAAADKPPQSAGELHPRTAKPREQPDSLLITPGPPSSFIAMPEDEL